MLSSKNILLAKPCPAKEREKQQNLFWTTMSPTMDSMIFTKDGESAMKDTLSVLDYLPDYKGKRILDLNAGIGRFTALMAKDAAHVTAVDIVQKFIDVNEKENQKYDNITFICADATKLDFPEGSFDLVFSGWLFTNICNESMKDLTERSLKWLAPGGHVYFRETFIKEIVDTDVVYSYSFNRNPVEYCQLLQNVQYGEACFRNILTKSILFHLLVCKENNRSIQSYYLAKRVSKNDADSFMDATNKLYTVPILSKLEWMFGQSWINPGGEETVKKLVCQVALSQGEYVLNLGCGTGGDAFFLAEHYGVDVHAVDLSANMISTAVGRLGIMDVNLRNKVQLETADITEAEFKEATYDVIYSCNSIFRFKDKQQVFAKLYRLLKPGGKLLFADFCKSDYCKEGLQEVLDNFAINLISIKDYGNILEDSGFGDILVKDDSENLSRVLQKDLKGFNTTKESFVEEFSTNEFFDLVKWATNAINWVDSKQLAWGIFTARKC